MNESRRKKFQALDLRFDQLLEPTRNFKPTVWLFNTATALGDFGLLWHIVGIVRAVADTTRVRQALILSSLMGVESLLVNQGIKPFFADNDQPSKAIPASKFVNLALQVFQVVMPVRHSSPRLCCHAGLAGRQSRCGLLSRSSSPPVESPCEFIMQAIFSPAPRSARQWACLPDSF